MRKSFLFPLCVLTGILLFSLLTGTLMDRHTARWREQLHRCDAFAQSEQWPEATQTLVESYQNWQTHRVWLHVLARHDIVDGAETMYTRAIAFSAAREPSEFRAELADLDAQLELLAETERLSLQNIL